ncbi:MAG: dipeptide epimerase [Defluviitaleaceae bacterium]|nr:dipeptide epimerase [Defluviitaleaceae bacterium]
MKITDIKYERLRIKFKKPFVIAIGVMEYGETLIVKMTTDEGITGYGEASPYAPVTGETLDSVLIFLELFKPALIGQNPFELEKIHKAMNRQTVGNTSAKAAIDIALHDIIGKKLGMPVYQVLGGYRNSFVTDMTVGIGEPAVMAQDALNYANDGFNVIKVKAGINPGTDIEAIKQIRKAVGDGVKLRVDANQGWDVNSAIRVMREYEKYGVDAVEQPLVHWDLDGLAYVRSRTNIMVMADESLHSPEDAMKLAKKQAVDVFNIKLMKCGGLYPAARINAIGESAGIQCMLGCMIESRLGISASASFVAAQKNVTEADLDSFRHYDESAISGGFTLENGVITMLDKPGLGVDVDF